MSEQDGGDVSKRALQAQRAVEAIVCDLEDRRGMRHVWGDFSEPLQASIKASWVTIVLDRITALEAAKDKEIAALNARNKADLSVMREYKERWDRAESEIAALKADNAALVDVLADAEAELPAIADHKRNPGSTIGALTQLHARLCEARIKPHPGTAMLEQLRKHEEAIKALADVLDRHIWLFERHAVLADFEKAMDALRLAGRLP